ncbi:MAG: hypothetical protein ACJAYF_001990 [Arenicella sp.]|jgi:hypothetical protein
MSPKKRLPQNKGLPQRWRHRKNGYYYRVPAGQEHAWEGKTEFHLGKKLSEAYRAYAERIESPENMRYVQDLLNRYSLEVLPDKAPKTQVNELVYIRRLSAVFHNVRIDALSRYTSISLWMPRLRSMAARPLIIWWVYCLTPIRKP